MRDFSIIKQNILQYLDFKGISKYEFYQKTGVSNGVLSQKSGLSEDNTLRFISYYSDVSPEWLLTGKGSMLKEDNSLAPEVWEGREGYNSEKKGLPLIPIEAMAGFGSGETQVMDYEAGNYVVPEFEELNADFLIHVKGSSMYPKYSSGDIVACKKLSLDIFFQWNKVYVLDTSQGAVIKRIHPSEKENHLLCVSENEKYPPFDIPLSEVYAIALVVGVIRFE